MLLLNHLRGHMIHLFYIFSFLFLKFSSPYSPKKKKKKKKNSLLLPISSHMLLHFFQLSPSLFSSLSLYYFLLYRYTSFILLSFLYYDSSSSFLYFDSSSLYFILYNFDIIFFPPKNYKYSLSLSLSLLSFGSFLFFLITLI